MDNPIIEFKELTKTYDSLTAVDHLNLTIQPGEVFGLLGPNGAGKSTTILMMLGLTEPTSGSAYVCGINATTHPIEVKRIVGYLPDDVGFYDNQTGFQNLLYTARLNSISQRESEKRAHFLLKRVGLEEASNKKTGKYSRGMRQRLGLADVLIKNPQIIVLDEPTLGIDPQGVREFLELIVQLSKEENITVLLSSHHLHQVQQICDRVGIFVSGKLLAHGDIPSLSRKLFKSDLYTIEIGVEKIDIERLGEDKIQDALLALPGVTSVKRSDNIFHIGCTQDIRANIARTLIENGYGLTFLNQKEYGLDDIYHRYFKVEKE